MIWKPSAERSVLRERAELLTAIRFFFVARAVLEVETPILGLGATVDPHIDSFCVQQSAHYLQTSPEFFMKRLLAAGSGDIFQVSRVFRQGEAGRFHNPEFSLLEWYRLGFSQHDLMQEVIELIQSVFPSARQQAPLKLAYREAFQRFVGLDVAKVSCPELAAKGQELGLELHSELSELEWLDLLMAEVVAHAFPTDRLTLIYDYPANQASLAQVRAEAFPVAERFEVYWGALELGNGFHELQDAKEQQQRFIAEQQQRQQNQQLVPPYDEKLIQALAQGLPDCSGVAIGIDRLLMLMSDAEHIKDVLSFDWART